MPDPGSIGAVAFWERRRVPYNLALAVVVIAWVTLTWPHFRPAFNWADLARLLGLAGIANLLYCAAYLADLAVPPSAGTGLRVRWRSGVWLAGTLFALLVENYWIADEIYPFVR